MAKKNMSFEQAMNRLEDIINKIERPETGLEESVKLYKEGADLSVFCTKALNSAEAEIIRLQKSASGEFVEKPFTEDEE